MSTKEKETKNTRITVVLIDLNDEAYESNISCDTQLNVISSLASKMSVGLNQMSSRAHNTRSNNQPPSTPTSDRIVYV